MRYLLDTNIVVFLLLSELDNITNDTHEILNDFGNHLAISSVSVMELIQLYRIGKIKTKKYKTVAALYSAIESEFFIEILPFTKEHTQTLSKLKVVESHNDPFDHSIISHAITNNLILVSSDSKFKEYIPQKLSFVFNKRS